VCRPRARFLRREIQEHPIIIASLETTNSPEVIRECVDAGAAGMIVKTLTDIEDMARLTENSKYAILNERTTHPGQGQQELHLLQPLGLFEHRLPRVGAAPDRAQQVRARITART
jgi:hypothetical protein